MKKILSLLICLSLTSCRLISDKINHIKDTNGNDTSIVTITEEEKIKNVRGTATGEILFSNNETSKVIEGSASYDIFSGVTEIMEIEATIVEYFIEIEHISGNFEIVFISENSIIKTMQIYDEMYFVLGSKGNQKMKFVGESAKLSLIFNINY